MAKGKPISLHTISFDNKGEASAFFKAMLHRYRPNDLVGEEDGRHLASLLERHPQAAEKIGSGVDHFVVIAADYGTQCFCAVRTDLTMERFSYVECIRAS